MSTSSLALAIENAKLTLSNVSAFQTFCNTPGDVSATAARIHRNGLPAPADGLEYTKAEMKAYRPFAEIWVAENRGFSRRSVSVGDTGYEFMDEGGRINVRIYRNTVADTIEPSSADMSNFEDEIGNIIDGLCELSANPSLAGALAFHRIELVDMGAGHPTIAKTLGQYLGATLTLEWSQQ